MNAINWAAADIREDNIIEFPRPREQKPLYDNVGYSHDLKSEDKSKKMAIRHLGVMAQACADPITAIQLLALAQTMRERCKAIEAELEARKS